jgi:hypothetical protein
METTQTNIRALLIMTLEGGKEFSLRAGNFIPAGNTLRCQADRRNYVQLSYWDSHISGRHRAHGVESIIINSSHVPIPPKVANEHGSNSTSSSNFITGQL